jgi:hypothetical protein
MRYFKPTDPKAVVACYGDNLCSAKKPVGLDGYLADKAARNPHFTEVVKRKVAKKKAVKK